MAYVDFSYYRDIYLGSAVPEADFPRLAERAGERLEADSGGLVATATGAALEAVKRCCCSVAEILYKTEQSQTAGEPTGAVLKSETVGSWRREYELTPDATQTVDAQISTAEKQYLGGWGLLYRGVRPCVH